MSVHPLRHLPTGRSITVGSERGGGPRRGGRSRGPAAGAGWAAAGASAAAFGTSGTLATSLLRHGWTPAAAVLARITLAAVVLALPAVAALRRWAAGGRAGGWRRQAPSVVAYGLVAVAGCQVCYFEAVARMSAAPALLLEYSGTLLVVAWMWVRHGQAPARRTLAGAAASVVGLVLVIGLGGDQRVSAAGVAWGLAAAVGLAGFFVLSAGPGPGGEEAEELPPLVVAWGGMVLGAVGLALVAAAGALPLHAAGGQVSLLGHRVSWAVPVLGLAVVAGALAYVSGVRAARSLGARLSSFVGLTEVLCSAGYAWAALGERLSAAQVIGGVVVLGGIALVRSAEPAAAAGPAAPGPTEPGVGTGPTTPGAVVAPTGAVCAHPDPARWRSRPAAAVPHTMTTTP